jgi:hypothetical protein
MGGQELGRSRNGVTGSVRDSAVAILMVSAARIKKDERPTP